MSFYFNLSKHIEERAIRRFEVNETNMEDSDNLKKFSWIYPVICLNAKMTKEKIENIFKENFNAKILDLIKKDYFQVENEGVKTYDIRKIKILIFLLTTNTSESENSDKGSYFISLFQSNSNDNLEDAIRFEDIELNECLNIMIDISCNEIYNFYLDENQITITNQIVKMTGVKQKVLNDLLIRIFGLNNKTNAAFLSITPIEFVNQFNQNNLFMTSGYIREIAFDDLCDKGLQQKPKKCCTIF